MLHEFHAVFQFFPELQVSVNTGRYNEIRFRDNNMRNYITMHISGKFSKYNFSNSKTNEKKKHTCNGVESNG